MWKLLWGAPVNPTSVRFRFGPYRLINPTTGCTSPERERGRDHAVGRWYGLIFKRDLFVGVMVFGKVYHWTDQVEEGR